MNKIDIDNVLINIGIPIGLRGFDYITQAILLLDKPEWKHPKWTALYYCIGQMFDVSASLVESSIRHAFKVTRTKCTNPKNLEYYIGFINCENSNSLMQLYNRIKQNEKQNNCTITKLMLKETLLELIN